jgi:L-asparaginase II
MPDPSMPPGERQVAANPVLVDLTRGELVESFARGAFAISDSEGEIVASLGDVERAVFPRSAYKLIQAIPLIESGAAETLNISDTELALACASHSGEAQHVAAVAAWLARIGAKETDLECGAHAPLGAAAADALVREGKAPSRVHNNCSGKHTGFLALARQLGAPFKGYGRLDHPVQRAVIEALSDLSHTSPQQLAPAIDGCGAPNFALPLSALAGAMARIADPEDLAPPRREAIVRLLAAVRAQPFYAAGTGRLCTRIMTEAPNVYAKVGAEGVYVAALPALGLGVALKIDDGGKHASEALFVALLVGLGALAPDCDIVRDTAIAPVRNTQGRIAAVREVALDLLIETLAEFSPQALAAAGGARARIEDVGGEMP